MKIIKCYYTRKNMVFLENNISDTISNIFCSTILENNKGNMNFFGINYNNRNFQESITFFLKHGNINAYYSYKSTQYLFSVGEKHTYTITGCTGKYLGCEGFLTIKIISDTMIKVKIKLMKKLKST